MDVSYTERLRIVDPEWVLVGMPWRRGDGGYAILASRKLTYAQLTAHGQTLLSAPSRRQELSATLEGYHLAVGRTYAEAFVKLLQEWDPDHLPALTGATIDGEVIDPS